MEIIHRKIQMITWSECWKKLKKSSLTTLPHTKLTETLSNSVKYMWWQHSSKITKGSGKRMQEDQVDKVHPKRPELMLSTKKSRFVSDSESSDTEYNPVTRAYAKSVL